LTRRSPSTPDTDRTGSAAVAAVESILATVEHGRSVTTDPTGPGIATGTAGAATGVTARTTGATKTTSSTRKAVTTKARTTNAAITTDTTGARPR